MSSLLNRLLNEGFRGTGKDNFERPEPTSYPPAGNERTFTVEISLNPGESADGGEKRPSATFSEPVRVSKLEIHHIGTTESRLKFLKELEAAIQGVCAQNDVGCDLTSQ